MVQRMKFYIDGIWAEPASPNRMAVVNPANEETMYEIALGSKADVDAAVDAAKRSFKDFSNTSRDKRLALLGRVIDVYRSRIADIAASISDEMGAPLGLAEREHAAAGLAHFETIRSVLEKYSFEETIGSALVVREPIGVVGMITPWNWPMNQIGCKVAAALATGCSMVLKPSEFTPSCALIFAEILHEAGVPSGVFNLVNGLGPEVGVAMSEHPDIDMMSFTGSTRAGVDVAIRSAATVKRVSQELGGKSPNIILDDADLEQAVASGVACMMLNTGQSCDAPSRMIVPADRMREAARIAKMAVEQMKVGDPRAGATTHGPVVNRTQWERIQAWIERGLADGATLVAGGTGLPEGINRGYYVRPTIFADVTSEMAIAQEEIFGPVLVLMKAEDEAHAIRIANDTPYGLAGYVTSGSIERARNVARQVRAGSLNIQGVFPELAVPFGGYKRSGNGREWGRFGMEDFLETKAIAGY
ncbi:aldehyde dehydrogenase [Mesorhizobium sp. LNHC220B00]|nr:aldehyde dehydrogenase family protein [Mesorhizobium sp. LNHC220B00]ESY85953.1 aldehyde dehydrogenase [Mesorhizobium sp. LNHC220B00]